MYAQLIEFEIVMSVKGQPYVVGTTFQAAVPVEKDTPPLPTIEQARQQVLREYTKLEQAMINSALKPIWTGYHALIWCQTNTPEPTCLPV